MHAGALRPLAPRWGPKVTSGACRGGVRPGRDRATRCLHSEGGLHPPKDELGDPIRVGMIPGQRVLGSGTEVQVRAATSRTDGADSIRTGIEAAVPTLVAMSSGRWVQGQPSRTSRTRQPAAGAGAVLPFGQ